MLNRLTLRPILYGAILLLAALGLLQAASGAFQALQLRQAADGALQSNATADLLLSAAGAWAAERGGTAMALRAEAPASAERRAALEAQRGTGDGAVAQAIALLRADGRAAEQATARALGAFAAAQAEVAALRRRADAALAQPRAARDAALPAQWWEGMRVLIETSQSLRLAQRPHAGSTETRLAELQSLKHFIWLATEFLGRERGIVAGLLAGGAPISLAQLELLATHRGQVETAWAMIEAELESGGPQAAQAAAAVRERLFGAFGQLRRAVYAAGTGGQPYPVSGEQWWREATAVIDQLRVLSTAAGVEAARLAAQASGAALAGFILYACGLGLAAGVGLGAWLMVSRRVLHPLLAMTTAMRRLADRDFGAAIPGQGRRDEIGAMAAAVQVFRHSMIEGERLAAAQRAEQEEKAARAARVERLAQGFKRDAG